MGNYREHIEDVHNATILSANPDRIHFQDSRWTNPMSFPNALLLEKVYSIEWKVRFHTSDFHSLLGQLMANGRWGQLLCRSVKIDKGATTHFNLELKMHKSNLEGYGYENKSRGGGKGGGKGKGDEWVTVYKGGQLKAGREAVLDAIEQRRNDRKEQDRTRAATAVKFDVSTAGLMGLIEQPKKRAKAAAPEEPAEAQPSTSGAQVHTRNITWDVQWRLPWRVRWKHLRVLGMCRKRGPPRRRMSGSARWRRLSRSAWACSEFDGEGNRHMQLIITSRDLTGNNCTGRYTKEERRSAIGRNKCRAEAKRKLSSPQQSGRKAATEKPRFKLSRILKLSWQKEAEVQGSIRPATKRELTLRLFRAGDIEPHPGPQNPGQSFFIELYGGSMAAARAAKTIYPRIICICVDSESRAVLEKRYAHLGLAAFLASPGVVFIRFDLRLITPRDLQMWCVREVRSAGPTDIVGVHASVVCTTLTQAGECNKSRENCAVSSHRGKFGMALTVQAQYDDKALRACLELLEWVASAAPDCVITVENGWHSHFRKHDLVQGMIGKGGSACWQILKTDLCAAASPTLDTVKGQRMTFPMKPTAVLVRFPAGQVRSHLRKKSLPRCAGAECPMIIEGQRRHQVVVCTKKRKNLEQQTEQSRAKVSSILPRGLFDVIWAMAASAEEDTAKCAVCGQPGAQRLCRCGRKVHNICADIMARGSDDIRCTSCSMSDRLDRHMPTMTWDAIVEISNNELWAKGGVKGEGLRYICINNKSPKEVLHLDAPNIVHIQFDPVSICTEDIKTWCRMLGVKTLLGIRISIDTTQLDLEKGRPTSSAHAQEELQGALNAISVGRECGEIEPEALVVIEAPLDSRIWERRSVRKARHNFWLAELRGQPARSAMIKGKGQAEATESCTDAEIWRHHENGLWPEGTIEATVTVVVYTDLQGKQNKVTELNTRDETMTELEGYLQREMQIKARRHTATWTKHGHDMATRWCQGQEAEACNGAWIVIWHFEEGEEKLGWEGQSAYSWNTAGFELLTQIATTGRAMCVVAGRWTEGFVGNTRIREMVERDWWMLETGCADMPAIMCKGTRPEDAEVESDPVNKRQTRPELLQQMLSKRKTFLQQQDGWDYFCAVCENGGDLIGCDSIGCTRVQHREGSGWKEGERWFCHTCAMEEECKRMGHNEGHAL